MLLEVDTPTRAHLNKSFHDKIYGAIHQGIGFNYIMSKTRSFTDKSTHKYNYTKCAHISNHIPSRHEFKMFRSDQGRGGTWPSMQRTAVAYE